ncbi:MAG: superfamily II DNA/RNA helicase [Limimaricola cinnabarinus]|jgi:superfamily II DNA/RNA helicase|uniref:DEAD/DEAH box helicase n=1 Tax=Limimaricola cinnabarinus TaxID=1125964 RepID=UPI0039E56D24
MTQFSDLNLDPKVLKAIAEAGYETPTPIQAGAIPPALEGRDVLGIAQTGTGKTASFVLPMITLLGRGRARARMPRSLVLCPTRELAAQVAENFDTYAKHTKLTKALLIGGVSFKEQDTLIDKGVDVLIATPGRLLDHFERGKLLLTGVQIMVVDEADRMLDMGFIPDIERIFGLTPFTRQTLFFSATMAPEIERITNTFLSNPEKIEVARAATTGENIKQGVVMFRASRKDKEAAEKRDLLRALIDAEGEACTNAIIFCNRKMDVDVVAKSLKKHGYDAEPIHGDLDQSQRTRTLDGFRAGNVKILVASDVAARGLDVPSVSHVFNFDVPSHAEDYVHRIGRTGRAGRKGSAIMICNPRDEKNLEDVERLVQNPIPRLDDPRGAKAPAAAAPATETATEEERPRRSRTRSRSRSRDEAKPEAFADAVATETPKVEARPKQKADVEPASKAASEPEPRVEAKPAPDPDPVLEAAREQAPAEPRRTEPRGNERDRNRGGRDRRRHDQRDEEVVGMGEDTPAFIAKSFEERRAG